MKKLTNQEKYNQLQKDHTTEELADALLLPSELTKEQEEEVAAFMSAYRKRQIEAMEEVDHIYAHVMQVCMRMIQNAQLKEGEQPYRFQTALADYLHATRRSQKRLAQELGISVTKMSKLINGKIGPNKQLCYRLEKHSDHNIKATWWWQLYLQETIYDMNQEEELKLSEQAKVSHTIKEDSWKEK